MKGGMMDIPLLISEMIDYAARYHGEVEVVGRRLDDTIERSNWAEIQARSAQLANALAGHGYDENARIATLAWNTLDHLVMFYGVLGLGIPLHTLNPRLDVSDLAYMVDLVEDDICFFDEANANLALQISQATTTIGQWGFIGEAIPDVLAEMPDITTVHVETPTSASNLGAKGAGEYGTAAAPGAVLSAVNDALGALGARIDAIPITPEDVLRALRRW